MNKKEKTYTVVVHEVGEEDQVREHVDQLSASMLPTEFEMAFPEEVKYIEVLVETVVDLEDYDENVGTLFSKIIKIK